LQVIDALALELVQNANVATAVVHYRFVDLDTALLKRTAGCRSVEDDVLDLLPRLARVLPANDAHGFLKGFPIEPQLAVEGDVWQPFREPAWSEEAIALTGQELLPIPVCSYAIELLTHSPEG